MRATRGRQRGIAILLALIMVALATVTAVAIDLNAGLFASRSAAVYGQAEALHVATGAEALAAYGLRLDATNANSQNLVDSLDEEWAKPYGPWQVDNGVTLQFQMIDLEGRFNLNNLIDEKGNADPIAGPQFEQLLVELGLDTRWRALLTDWIDSDSQPSPPDGAEDSTYMGIKPGYRTPNLPITSVSEILALPGMTRAIYDKLRPFVTALPPGSQVNLCTASGEVLDALVGHIEYSGNPAQLAEQRKHGCFPDLQTFENGLDAATKISLQGRIRQYSEHFRLQTFVTIGTTRFTLYSLIERHGAGQRTAVQLRTVLRTFGTE